MTSKNVIEFEITENGIGKGDTSEFDNNALLSKCTEIVEPRQFYLWAGSYNISTQYSVASLINNV